MFARQGLLAPLDDANTSRCVLAERAFSRTLAGSCNVPLAGFAEALGQVRTALGVALAAFAGAPWIGERWVQGTLASSRLPAAGAP